MRKQSKLVYTDSDSINIQNWTHQLSLERQQSDLHLLREACMLAQLSGDQHLTPNGESCLHQGLAMAEILADLNLDDYSIAAAIVYSSVQHAGLQMDVVVEHLSDKVGKLIAGTQQMDSVHALHGKLTQGTPLATTIDNLRKMLLAMVDDVRVVFLKLSERLCILKNMLSVSDAEKTRIAQETMDIYAPLANRLGIGHLKWQLEDLSFRYLNPEQYLQLSREIKDRRVVREEYVAKFKMKLKEELSAAQISEYEVSGRAKHIYSICKKMQRKNVSISEIYDAIAFRILVPTIEDCYLVLSIVHSLWSPFSKEFDDYITHPKPNGYRSIHTAVIGPDNKFVEIQIRTFDMHQEAELGVAAHWLYKEGASHESGYQEKIAWLRQVMDWQKEVTEGNDQEVFSKAFEDRLYIFTPNGDVIDLPIGATPLDFAYQIHSELGHRCRGAKVNGHIVPLTYSLHSGEKVEILTTKQGHPSRDWLNPHHGYLKTARAKAKVMNWFRKQDYDRHVLEGHEMLDKELKRLGKELSHDELVTKLQFKSKEELFAALGRGDLRIHNVLLQLQAEPLSETEKLLSSLQEQKKSTTLPTDIDVGGIGNLMIHLAKCCKPVPGDKIVGYITVGRGVSIHREDCPNTVERFSLSPGRKIDVKWGTAIKRRYPTDLSILAYDKPNLLQDIISLLANEHIPIVSVNAVPNRKNNTTTLYLTVEVDDVNPLSRLLVRLSQLTDIVSVHRE